jgi:hypothetical protein
MGDLDLSRRAFVTSMAAAGAVALAFPDACRMTEQSSAPGPAPMKPVVGFYMDRPYLDTSGTMEPYFPPAGTRSGQVLAQLSDGEFSSRHPYG